MFRKIISDHIPLSYGIFSYSTYLDDKEVNCALESTVWPREHAWSRYLSILNPNYM